MPDAFAAVLHTSGLQKHRVEAQTFEAYEGSRVDGWCVLFDCYVNVPGYFSGLHVNLLGRLVDSIWSEAEESWSRRTKSDGRLRCGPEELCERVLVGATDGHRALLEGDQAFAFKGSRTQALVAAWRGASVAVGWIGAGLVYRLTAQGKLERLITEHSLLADWLASPAGDPAAVDSFPYHGVVTRAIGSEVSEPFEVASCRFSRDETLLIVSRHVHGERRDETFAEALDPTSDPSDQALEAVVAGVRAHRAPGAVIAVRF